MQVLLAEDRPKTAELMRRALEDEGYAVRLAFDGARALELGRTEDIGLILLDVMLPRLDGFTVLRKLREARFRTPVIIVTARDAKEDILHGLDAGADDYLTKPFEFDILLARVRAVARRAPSACGAQLPEVAFQDLRLNPNTYELQRGERKA